MAAPVPDAIHRVRVFVASPSDVEDERQAIERALAELNRTLGQEHPIFLEYVGWETHAWPGFDVDGQAVINDELPEYDIFIGVMWKRIGTKTGRASSGTIEEFDRAYERWLEHKTPHLMWYFSSASVKPVTAEIEQLPLVVAFQALIVDKGALYWHYEDVPQLERFVREHISRHVTTRIIPTFNQAGNGGSASATPAEASRPTPRGATLRDACGQLLKAAQERDRFPVRLPKLRVPCTVLTPEESEVRRDDATVVGDAFLDGDEEVLILLGEVGAGKSALFRYLADRALKERRLLPLIVDYAELAKYLPVASAVEALAQSLEPLSTRAANEFREAAENAPQTLLILIDAFDEINFSLGYDTPSPNLDKLGALLRSGVKTAVGARSSMTASKEGFLSQLVEQPSTDQVDDARTIAPRFSIVELLPCETDELKTIDGQLPPEKSAAFSTYLDTLSGVRMDRVRRPLFLQMLVDLPSGTSHGDAPFSIYKLYDDYVETTLSHDVGHRNGQQSSAMPVRTKRHILQNVANDMFGDQKLHSDARVAAGLVKERINDAVTSKANSAWVEREDRTYDWVADFDRSNHLLVAQTGAIARVTPPVAFVHQSLFEFFLSQHFATTFYETGRFGLEDDRHTVRAFDSLLPYFLRSQFNSYEGDGLIQLVRRDATSDLDRLVAFFFLEDSPDILKLLGAIDTEYRPFLLKAETSVDSFFMQKIVRYQLILTEQSQARAIAYVCDAREKETDQAQDIEVHTFATGRGPTDFLLRRLENPSLRSTRPITVYRLGQFGDTSALTALDGLETKDPCFAALIQEAHTRIAEREERPS